jgi:hypothetical protein
MQEDFEILAKVGPKEHHIWQSNCVIQGYRAWRTKGLNHSAGGCGLQGRVGGLLAGFLGGRYWPHPGNSDWRPVGGGPSEPDLGSLWYEKKANQRVQQK